VWLAACGGSSEKPEEPRVAPTLAAVRSAAKPQPGRLEQVGGRAASGPPIILITIDALRPDHLGCYGYGRKTSPFLDRLAAEGVRFTNVISTSSWTAPAMASLFSGRYPRSHSVRHGIYLPEKTTLMLQEVLPLELETLAERLRRGGYATYGVSTNPHLIRSANFNQGFTKFREDHSLRAMRERGVELSLENARRMLVDAEKTTRAAFEILQDRDPRRPYFLWVHYMDPHSPYFPRSPWFERFSGRSPEAHSELLLKMARHGYLADRLINRDTTPPQEEIDIAVAAYDSEIAYADSWIERLLAGLPESDRAAVFVLADHGEQFFEHGFLTHGFTLHGEEIRIPLIVRLPAGERRAAVVDAPVNIVDVPTTIEEYALGRRTEGDQGISLLPYLRGTGAPVDSERLLVSELERYGTYEVTGIRGRRKLIWRPAKGEQLLFDLELDPGETQDRSAAEPAAVKTLRRSIEQWQRATPRVEGQRMRVELDPEDAQDLQESIVESLRALGYVE
jgi:arylsulfatase